MNVITIKDLGSTIPVGTKGTWDAESKTLKISGKSLFFTDYMKPENYLKEIEPTIGMGSEVIARNLFIPDLELKGTVVFFGKVFTVIKTENSEEVLSKDVWKIKIAPPLTITEKFEEELFKSIKAGDSHTVQSILDGLGAKIVQN